MSDAAFGALEEAPSSPGTNLRAVIDEFGRILDVLNVQLTDSVEEANRECAALGGAFHELAAANSRIDALASGYPEPLNILKNSAQIGHSLDTAIVALQYQDRLSQRIGHICGSLHHLQHLLRDGRERSYDEWLGVLRHVEYTQQLEQARLHGPGHASNGSAELF